MKQYKKKKEVVQTFIMATKEQSELISLFYKTYNKRYGQKMTKSEGYKLIIDTFKDNIKGQVDKWENEIADFLAYK